MHACTSLQGATSLQADIYQIREEEDLLNVGRGLGSADSASSASSERVMLRRFFGPPFLLGAPAPLLPVSAVHASAATAAALAAAAAASSYRQQISFLQCTMIFCS